ncbi:MAG TPA: hypothetical protein VMH87_00690 [Pseudomonadales bacterium]|nr:hypothetical protein [Pseudomonadales bacterium]
MEIILHEQICRRLISSRVYLINAATISALTGCGIFEIKKHVESGELLWAFNFSFSQNSAEPRVHALRFWVEELAKPVAVKDFTVEQVVQKVLGTMQANFSPGDICRRFCISKVQLGQIRRKWDLPLGKIRRESLADFLKARWTGNNN